MWNNKKIIILANEHKQSKKSTVSHLAQQNGNVFQFPEAKTQFLLANRHP